jgi:hypothetical protein
VAIKPWKQVLALGIGAGFFLFMWRVRRAASPDKLLGEVREIRRKWLWALEAGKLLLIRHDTHNTPTVRLQFRKPEAVMAIRLQPREAVRIATLLREAACQCPSGSVTPGNSDRLNMDWTFALLLFVFALLIMLGPVYLSSSALISRIGVDLSLRIKEFLQVPPLVIIGSSVRRFGSHLAELRFHRRASALEHAYR